jgi:hypothetical protein
MFCLTGKMSCLRDIVVLITSRRVFMCVFLHSHFMPLSLSKKKKKKNSKDILITGRGGV